MLRNSIYLPRYIYHRICIYFGYMQTMQINYIRYIFKNILTLVIYVVYKHVDIYRLYNVNKRVVTETCPSFADIFAIWYLTVLRKF